MSTNEYEKVNPSLELTIFALASLNLPRPLLAEQ